MPVEKARLALIDAQIEHVQRQPRRAALERVHQHAVMRK
jgi:hypothetical protein